MRQVQFLFLKCNTNSLGIRELSMFNVQVIQVLFGDSCTLEATVADGSDAKEKDQNNLERQLLVMVEL